MNQKEINEIEVVDFEIINTHPKNGCGCLLSEEELKKQIDCPLDGVEIKTISKEEVLEMKERGVKIVVVGSGSIGKKSLILPNTHKFEIHQMDEIEEKGIQNGFPYCGDIPSIKNIEIFEPKGSVFESNFKKPSSKYHK